MTKNVCGIDRVWRIALGATLLGLTATGVIGWWGWLGAIPVVTGVVGWCPFYVPFKLNSCRR